MSAVIFYVFSPASFADRFIPAVALKKSLTSGSVA